jgi:hypothetical protein
MTQEVLVWDSSAGHALLWWRAGEQRMRLVKRYEKRCFLTQFPLFLEEIADTLTIGPDTTVYLGAGPGSFTGLKTGIAVLGGFLYARGVTTVRLISSLDIASLRVPWTDGELHIVARLFNENTLFLSAFEWRAGMRHSVIAEHPVSGGELDALLSPYVARNATLIAAPDLPPTVEDMFSLRFSALRRLYPGEELRMALLPTLPLRSVVDLRKEPLLLEYMATPADLQGEHTAYYVSMN